MANSSLTQVLFAFNRYPQKDSCGERLISPKNSFVGIEFYFVRACGYGWTAGQLALVKKPLNLQAIIDSIAIYLMAQLNYTRLGTIINTPIKKNSSLLEEIAMVLKSCPNSTWRYL